MDDDLWGPPKYYPATEDQMPSCLSYDVLEDENELNEKSCIQVLEIWISKANTEIAEREEELMELVSQLACFDEVFSDLFSKILKSKIDFVESSIKKFKDDAEGFFSTSREPAESIPEILKSVFCQYLEKKDLQTVDVNIGSAIVPYVESSEAPNANSTLNANANEKQIVVREQELDTPPGYPKSQPIKNETGSLPLSLHCTRTYIKKERQVSSQRISSSSVQRVLAVSKPLAVAKPPAVAKPLAGPDRRSTLYIEEDYYTVPDLRAIARERNVKGYCKLRKAELAQLLGIKVIEGRRKQPKKEDETRPRMIKIEPYS